MCPVEARGAGVQKCRTAAHYLSFLPRLFIYPGRCSVVVFALYAKQGRLAYTGVIHYLSFWLVVNF